MAHDIHCGRARPRYPLAGLLALSTMLMAPAFAQTAPAPHRIAKGVASALDETQNERAPIDPRGKPLFRSNPSAPPLGHHWVKVNDKIGFWVGMRIEPAYEREANGIEVYAVKDVEGYDDAGYPIGGVAVDPVANPGDTVNITANYELLANLDPQGKVIASKNIGRIGQGRFDVPEMGYFVTEFIPNPAGRYAIVFGGEINGAKIDNRTVCAFEEEEVHTFSCINTRTPGVF